MAPSAPWRPRPDDIAHSQQEESPHHLTRPTSPHQHKFIALGQHVDDPQRHTHSIDVGKTTNSSSTLPEHNSLLRSVPVFLQPLRSNDQQSPISTRPIDIKKLSFVSMMR